MTTRKQTSSTPVDDLERTRHRLIEAGGEVFAEKGFRDATVRDICQRAGANVAAVNYHFRDKQSLYSAAIQYAHTCAKRFDGDMTLPVGSNVDDRLRAFLRAMLMGMLEDGKPAWHGKLIAREMAEPTGVLTQMVMQTVRPRFAILSSIVRDVLGPGASDAAVRLCARSIVGQALFYHFAKPILFELFPDERFDASAVDKLVDHIATFSLHGLRGMASDRSASVKRKKVRRS